MIVVVDSGSTKADWRMADSEGAYSLKTIGFNPVFHSSEFIYDALVPELARAKFPADQVSDVFYYGAGCWDDRLKDVVHQALTRVFTRAEIMVEHDLLGAARATCRDQPGIAAILGTGSNSCLYDGKQVIDNVTNLGYLIGDEGSGTHLGKALIRAYFYREMPLSLREAFDKDFPGGKQAMLDHIYGEETPNVYLASFTRFIKRHQTHPFLQHLLHVSFAEFIDRHVRKYQNHLSLPIHFIGSVAFHFQEVMRAVLEERAMLAGIFIQKPIDHLVHFHIPSYSDLPQGVPSPEESRPPQS
jgi:glucosamine kinase